MPSDYIDQVAGAIVEQLKGGTAPWVKPWQPGERFMPYNPTSGKAYRGMNAVWLMSRAEARGYGDPRWMTYRQAQEARAQVRKGEAGSVIQFWKWQGLEPVRDADGKPILDHDGHPTRQMVRYDRPRVWSAVVFNAAQIDGLAPPDNRPSLPEWERHQSAETVLARFGTPIRHVSGDRAFYRLADDTITLPERAQFPSADRYYATALHEVGHATGHPSRLNRESLGQPFGSEDYAREELRAEIASMMLGEQLGIGHDPGQHAAYIGSWIRALEDDPREIFRAAADAEKITALVRSFERDHELGPAAARASEKGRGSEHGSSAPARRPGRAAEASVASAPDSERTYLAVPYQEKDQVKQLGARWDRQIKAWYVPAGVDLEAFAVWLPVRDTVPITVEVDPAEQFAEALRDCGLRPDGPVQMDGALHRVPVEGDRPRQRSGAYIGHLNGRPAGFIENFRTGVRTTWKGPDAVANLDAADRARLVADAAQQRHDRAMARERQYLRVADEVSAIWAAAAPATDHPYLDEKGVPSHDLRVGEDGRLLVPVRDASGRIWSLQHISPDGAKLFHEGGRVQGGHVVIGDIAREGPLLIAEGYATAATVHDLTGMPAVAAFNAGNLAPVSRSHRALYPDRAIYVAGDNDHRREAEGQPNVGRQKAEEAAAAVDGVALLPQFAVNESGSDWNDLVRLRGKDAARVELQVAIAGAERERVAQSLLVERKGDRSQAISAAPMDREREEVWLGR